MCEQLSFCYVCRHFTHSLCSHIFSCIPGGTFGSCTNLLHIFIDWHILGDMENGLFEFMALCAWLSVVVLVIGVFPGRGSVETEE